MADSSLNILRIRARPVLVPMKLPLHTASGAIDQAALVLLDLETTAGLTGRAYLFAPSAAHLAPIVALMNAHAAVLFHAARASAVSGIHTTPYELVAAIALQWRGSPRLQAFERF
jgi:hypothetical protein